MAQQTPQDDDDQLAQAFAADSDYAPPREDGAKGPPAGRKWPSWFSARELTWYWNDREDAPPVTPLGYRDGVYWFVTAVGEIRQFSSGQLHGRGGLTDLFSGNLWWPLKHFPKCYREASLEWTDAPMLGQLSQPVNPTLFVSRISRNAHAVSPLIISRIRSVVSFNSASITANSRGGWNT